MHSTRMPLARSMAMAVAAAGLPAGAVTAGAGGGVFTDGTPTDTVVNAAAGQSQEQFHGTFEKRDGCPYLVTPGGIHYYLKGYTIGGNGALYKKGGGFIAYPGWRIQANGTKKARPAGTTTLCTTWGASPYIKAKSIYALHS